MFSHPVFVHFTFSSSSNSRRCSITQQYLTKCRCLSTRLLYSIKLFVVIVHTLREDQPLRLLLNLLFYHFNRSVPTYKSQRIKFLDVIAACNQLNVNALNHILITFFSWRRFHRVYLIESKFLIAGNQCFLCNAL